VPVHYEFVVLGDLRPQAVPTLSHFEVSTDGGYTVLRGTLESEADLPTVLGEFAALGLGLHGVRQLPSGPGGVRAVPPG
jgi:hypothetical protein